MKALSIRQPWAELILQGVKTIENRTWDTKHRGPLAIHAGKSWGKTEKDDLELINEILLEKGMPAMAPGGYQLGGIVGCVMMTDVVTESTDDWFMGPFGFQFCEARRVDFVAWKGQLGLFDVPNACLRKCTDSAWEVAVDGVYIPQFATGDTALAAVTSLMQYIPADKVGPDVFNPTKIIVRRVNQPDRYSLFEAFKGSDGRGKLREVNPQTLGAVKPRTLGVSRA